jgi:fumarate hydratase class II
MVVADSIAAGGGQRGQFELAVTAPIAAIIAVTTVHHLATRTRR